MNAIVIEHVPVAELPAAWREKLMEAKSAHVTVRIEAETPTVATTQAALAADPAFGMWRDRDDMVDVAAYMRELRAPRYRRDGRRNTPR